ncbi:MAG: 16S rRNA (guanine(966)-N(2))-methyltransferase RsmD [Candidatus Margulisiibacteriota bacterium]
MKVPPGNIRPLSSQAKEALFNILQTRIADCLFLDLFAGSGAVGIEALSRGATEAIFIELDKKSANIIRENCAACGFSKQAEVYATDVLQSLKILQRKESKFDIIFIGAPYDSPALEKVLLLIGDSDLLNQSGIVIAEHRKQHQLADKFGSLALFRQERYGETVFNFYEKSHLPR